MISFNIYFRKDGGHVRTRWFAGREDGTKGLCGQLTFREEEWADLKARLSVYDSTAFNFIDDFETAKIDLERKGDVEEKTKAFVRVVSQDESLFKVVAVSTFGSMQMTLAENLLKEEADEYAEGLRRMFVDHLFPSVRPL